MDVTTSEVILLGKMEMYGHDFDFLGYRKSEMALLSRPLRENHKRREEYSFKCGAAVQRQCHLTSLMLPVTDKREATGSSSSRGKTLICFLLTKLYSVATCVSVLSVKKKQNK